MNKKTCFISTFIVLMLISPTNTFAYNLGIDISKWGYVNYSYPTVLGDRDEPEEHKVEDGEDEQESEVRETPHVEKPETIEIHQEENKMEVQFMTQERVRQVMSPEKVSLKFPASPKTNPDPKLRQNDLETSESDNMDEPVKQRQERIEERVEIQNELHDDGTVEMQIESRSVKAKIKSGEIEVDVKNNKVGGVDSQGNKVELLHLPDQAMQKFVGLGMSASSNSLEVGQSGNSFEYTIDAVKVQKLFGLIPRGTKFKLSLNDSTGKVEQKEVATSVMEQVLNWFSF